jgi:hypothetical protein
MSYLQDCQDNHSLLKSENNDDDKKMLSLLNSYPSSNWDRVWSRLSMLTDFYFTKMQRCKSVSQIKR